MKPLQLVRFTTAATHGEQHQANGDLQGKVGVVQSIEGRVITVLVEEREVQTSVQYLEPYTTPTIVITRRSGDWEARSSCLTGRTAFGCGSSRAEAVFDLLIHYPEFFDLKFETKGF